MWARKYTTTSVDLCDYSSIREDYVSRQAASNTQRTSRLPPASSAAAVGAGVLGPSVVGAGVLGPSVVGAGVLGPSVVGGVVM